MSKYAKLRRIMDEEREYTADQARLHEKHDQIPEDAVIVEKSTAVRSTVTFLKWILQAAAGVLFIALAAIGIITLLYPDIRSAFFVVLQEMVSEVKSMI